MLDTDNFPSTVAPKSIARRPTPPIWQMASKQSANLHGLLNGAPVFLIAGGPSFKHVDLKLLQQAGCLTMGLNNSPKTFRPDLWISVDVPSNFLSSIWLDPKIMKFARLEHQEAFLFDNESRITTDITVAECPNVFFYKSDLEFTSTDFLTNNSVSWGSNDPSGNGRSVMLATLKTLYHLGAGHVFLLGVDFEMSEDYTYHFPQTRDAQSVEGNRKSYKILAEHFSKLQPLFEDADFHIWNCNPASKLQVFPFLSLEKATEFATSRLPSSLDNEPSNKLYDKVIGRNDSAQTFAAQPSNHKAVPLRRIDRSKRPKLLKAEQLDSSPVCCGKHGVLLLAERSQEWLLPWWFHHFNQSNPNLPVAVADYGLSAKANLTLLR